VGGIVSVESQPLLPQWIKPLECEIVEAGRSRARIIVYVDGVKPGCIRVFSHGDTIIVYSVDEEEAYYCRIPLWFKPRRVFHRVNNGVLTIDAYGSKWDLLKSLISG